MSTVRAGTGEVDGYEPALHDADDAKDLQFTTDLLASHILTRLLDWNRCRTQAS